MLPQEEEMCQTFGVARNTIREALRILETQAVISVRPGRYGGPTVLPPNVDSIVSGLRIFLGQEGAVFEELLEARIAVERALAYRAASNVDADQLGIIEKLAAEMEEEDCPLPRFVELNLELHGQIAEASNNRVLQALQLTIRTMQGSSVSAHYSSEDRSDVIADHREIINAMRAKDPEAAEEAMGRHLHNFLLFMRKEHPEVLAQRLEPLMPTTDFGTFVAEP
jgi:DNA-binding FadR family transcriptional regulator